jgi:GH15 family glucan-1,4-alpha-glucosidase
MPYEPIANHGIIGNMHTAALVSLKGTIDWYCFPRFDSPSIFASILDDEKGGHFTITSLSKKADYKQIYWPDTNVLITRFLCPDGVAELIDYMPVHTDGKVLNNQIIRQISIVRGSMTFRMACQPAFNYARDEHQVQLTDYGASFHSSQLNMYLSTPAELTKDGKGVSTEFTLTDGDRMIFAFGELDADSENEERKFDPAALELTLDETVTYWRNWLRQCTYTGRWREQVYRSALALKLMIYEPTGAIIAAPTTSLPEAIGGERNWDYRYTWIRDASFTLYALIRIGFTKEANHFMEWIQERCYSMNFDGPPLQIMYGIDGRETLTEKTLDHLEGYRGSKPVRIGNAAYDQLQMDIYGELMDSVYLSNKYSAPISYELWSRLTPILDWLADNWQTPDEGVWEVRSGRQNFVYSRLMCWVALDRGVRLASKRSFPSNFEKWRTARDQIYYEIMEKGWDEERGAFVQHYDTQALDAANLIMPLVFFVAPNDPRMLRTLEAIKKPPEKGGLVYGNLVYRYNLRETRDGLSGEEGTFNMVTFWLVEALTRAGQVHREYLDEAQLIFEKMLTYTNHLGLYAEETGTSGEALGNFPQAFTHIALISAAFNLDRFLSQRN